jgi:hypothetical protein
MYYSLARAEGGTHKRILEWLAEAATELPQATADLKALRKLLRRTPRCVSKRTSSNGDRKALLAAVERG